MKTFDTTLYFITDSTPYSEEEFLFRVEEGLKGGAMLLQLREKERTTREYISLAEKVHPRIANFITHTFPIEKAPEAFELVDKRKEDLVRVAFTFD